MEQENKARWYKIKVEVTTTVCVVPLREVLAKIRYHFFFSVRVSLTVVKIEQMQ